MIEEFIEKLQKPKISRKTMLEAIKTAKKEKSASLAYEVACAVNTVFGDQESFVVRRQMQKVVIGSGDAEICAKFAGDVPNSNKNALKKAIIKSKNLDALIHFANVNVTSKREVLKLQKIIEQSNSAKYAFEFYDQVAGAKLKPLLDIAIKSKDVNDYEYLLAFKNYATESDLKLLNFAILKFEKLKKRQLNKKKFENPALLSK